MKTLKKILSVVLVCIMCLGIAATAAFGASYIGKEKAIEIAMENSKVKADNARFVTCEFDYDDGVAIYEVEFYCNKYEYSYDINAKTGTIIKYEKDWVGAVAPDKAFISEKAAKEIAFKNAGIAEADAKRVTVKLDYDDAVAKYEVEFYADGYEYDYEIDAVSGTILEMEKDRELSISFLRDRFARIIELFKSFFG